MTKPIKIALIGAGDIGVRAHLPALLGRKEVEIVQVVDSSPEARDRVEEAYPRFDVADILSVPVDAVVLATPPWVTPHLAADHLELGHFVLAEKPIAASLADADPLLALERHSLDRLQVGFTYRHHPNFGTLAVLVHDGRFGSPLSIRISVFDERIDPEDPDHFHRTLEALRYGPPLLHDGAHIFDFLNVLFRPVDQPRVFSAVGTRTDPGFPNTNFNVATLHYGKGNIAIVEVGWLLHHLPPSVLEIRGPLGHASLDVMTFDLSVSLPHGETWATLPGERDATSFSAQLDSFIDLIRGRKPAAEPGIDAGMSSLRTSSSVVKRMKEVG